MAAFPLGTYLIFCILVSSVFTQDATVSYRLMEENPAKYYIGSVAIDSQLFNDVSKEKFQQLQFQIIKEQNNYVTYFQIESNTSLLWTSKTIDREEFRDCFQDCIMEFNVAVFDLDLSEMTNIIKIIIDIEDDNDNAPVFLSINNPIQISEAVANDSVIASGAAFDRDRSEMNSVKTYILLPEMDPPVFSLVITETKEFELVNNIALDRETLSEYHLVIQAIDGGVVPLTGTATLVIEVTDANDNAPTFSEESYTVSVKENAVTNTVILTLSATDPDRDANGQIMYAFSNRVSDKISDLFYINSHSGELSVVGTIDYETDQKFSVQVIAYDLGEPSKSSTAIVYINIEDVNDNSPVINLNQPPGGTTLLESSNIGTFIAHVEIFDMDYGKNGIVSCTTLDKTFKLEKIGIGHNYKIVLNKSLDHDVNPRHNVTILCEDMGDLPRQTIANFILHVADVNDNAPVFTKSVYSVAITENNEIGISLVRVSAQDQDSGLNGQVSYALYPESDGLFILDSDTGLTTINVSLDRETHGDQRLFHVLAIDKGDPAQTATGTVEININDVNDNDPVFEKIPMEFYVFENLMVGSKVGNISVFDPDKDMNGTFKLIFPDNQEISEYFNFEQSGIITTRKVLDRESIAVHTCFVFAVDMGGRTSSAEVTIFVQDLNDNRPEVIYPNEYDHTIEVPVTHSSNSLVLQINARDYDSGNNSELYFTVTKDNSSGAFTLDHRSGQMYLNKSVDDYIGDLFTFDITVSDGGVPSLNTSVIISFHIVPAVFHASDVSSGISVNLWIVLGIVMFTVVLATTMIIIILKTCWTDKHNKEQKRNKSNIILESNEVDLKFDSSSAHIKFPSVPKEKAKEKDICSELQIDGFQQGYYDSLNETGYLTNSSTTSVSDRLYIEHVKTTNTDEIGSDNSGEMCTQDSGQGGSDVDLNITAESPGYHSLERQHNLIQMAHQSVATDTYNNSVDVYDSHLDCKHYEANTTENTSKSMAVFTINQKKTAEQKELSKLYKIQKRVMFSDDIENVNYNDAYKSLSILTCSDRFNDYYTHSKLNTALSEDNTSSPSNCLDGTETISSNCWTV